MTRMMCGLAMVLVGLSAWVCWSQTTQSPGEPASAPAAGSAAFGWRGDGTGRFAKADPVTEWDADAKKNILWSAEVGDALSSPVLAGNKVFVTSEPDTLLCLDRANGKILWQKTNGFKDLPDGQKAGKGLPPTQCGYATPTPVTDGECVYASFGTGIVACYDMDGGRKWIRHIQQEQNTQYGRSASAVLAGGRLVVPLSAAVALDAATGKTVWTSGEDPSYGSPVATKIADVDVVVTPTGSIVRVSDGKTLADGVFDGRYTSPVVVDGVVYHFGPPAVAVRLPDKAGDKLKTTKLWTNEDVDGETFSSPVVCGGLLYAATNTGKLFALDAKTGKLAYEKPLDLQPEGGNLYPSLIQAGKYVIAANDQGAALVVALGTEYKKVAGNNIGAGSGACPVADGKQIFLRGGDRLYCIGAK